MNRESFGAMSGLRFVRDVYGWTIPAVLLGITLLSCLFLRSAAFVILVLPFTLVFVLTLTVSYFVLGRDAKANSLEERVLGTLFPATIDGGFFTVKELAENESCPQAEIENALLLLHELAPIPFVWNSESGDIDVLSSARILTGCPECAALIPPELVRGRCENCHVYFARSERKKQFCRI